ncbi:MAG: hypothetical protein ACTS3R_18380 [Inquilinaceae bacterium]
MLLSFCGAAGTVTGSCYWLQGERSQVLVDCGMALDVIAGLAGTQTPVARAPT